MKRSSQPGSTVARRQPGALLFALLVLLTLTTAGPARADDRDLLRGSVGDPYVFILLDTSGSMNWGPKCPVMVPDPADPKKKIQVPANPNDCAFLCPTGDCFVPRNADDPNSKFYQAKQALHEVLETVDGIHFGFATYNQDQLQIRSKHWIYRADSGGPNIPGFGPYPQAGAQEVFGYLWNCDNGSGDAETGCVASRPADLSDAWEAARIQRLPKAGVAFNQTVTTYIRAAGQTYRLRYEPRGSTTPGQDVTIRVYAERCRNSSCSSRDGAVTSDVVFRPLTEFISWDNGVGRSNPTLGYFSSVAADSSAGNTCDGWDPNDDTSSDRHDGYSIRFPTDSSDPRGTFFTVGDVVPLDWTTDNKTLIQRRLAPNTALNPSDVPDFSMSRYFEDAPRSGDDFLRLKDERARPFVASGSTPLGHSVRAFRKWYAGCEQGTCPKGQGWSNVAAAKDPDWGCRRKFLLILTDGDDTCSGADPCSATASLWAQEGVTTYVVAFGVENSSGNKLNCMAANGNSKNPIYPQNKDELVKALTDIFGQIKEEASAFASAAVPSVQAEVADRIYLSSFTPLNGEAIWDGHLDAYLKPLPLDKGRPNRDKSCPPVGSPDRSSCHLWDAAEVLLGQAPEPATLAGASTLNASILKLGPAVDERRVFYTRAPFGGTVPRTLRLFAPPLGAPNADPEWADLFAGLRIDASNPTAAKNRAEDVIAETLVIKDSIIERQNGVTEPIRFVLGDVFHSDPVVIDRPTDFFFYSANLYGNPTPPTNCKTDKGYRCFADRLRYRRKMLMVGSNDGQLHFFDGGIWDPDRKKFTDGTGTELFSYIPRLGLPIVRELAEGGRHVFGMDGTPRIDDVFLDPEHAGTPDPDQREWRTVVLGGFREGGRIIGGEQMSDFTSGYFALDITQPDKVNTDNTPVNENIVPSCLSTTNLKVTGCGNLPFPAVLWEFTDSTAGSRWDEDGNGEPDLGQTWSVPTIGRVRVVEDGKTVEKFVAIFGGGMDAERKTAPRRGTWLYMVDVETGQPIYKRRLVGAAPADPAAVDVDLDGFLDVIYIGTTAGLVYKVDISTPALLEATKLDRAKAIPALAVDVDVKRVLDKTAATLAEEWDPYPIFTTDGRAIYFAPVAFYVASLNRFALAFGTGDREDMWSFEGQEGRFYLIVDDNFRADQAGSLLPLTEDDYREIDPDGSATGVNTDFVLNPATGDQRGWYFSLDPDERVITQAFGLAGVVVFSSFKPQVDIESNGPKEQVCARGGDSRIFVVYTNNGNPLMTVDGSMSRYRIVPEFVTSPYVEQGSTKNPDDGGTDANSEQLDVTQKQILATLKKFFPPGTKFGNYWISISGIRSDTGYERYATIPIGIIMRNWKEH